MSFLHWLHLKNLPPLHLSASVSIGSGLQTMSPGVFVHLNDESEGRVAKISCERFQKCIRTAPAQVPTAHSGHGWLDVKLPSAPPLLALTPSNKEEILLHMC